MAGKKTPRYRDGDNLTYDFFKDFFKRKPDRAAEFSLELITATAIWLPLDVYQQCPNLLPWVIRDPTCRRNAKKNLPEDWGSPSEDGYFRDDNSMVKGLVGAVAARGPRDSFMNGRRIGKGWVASHIWRYDTKGRIANTDARLNAFVPNLVWLPRQISKLSDDDGGPLQSVLQHMSLKIYKDVKVEQRLMPSAQEAWSLLALPRVDLEFNVDALTWFEASADFVEERQWAVRRVIEAIASIEADKPIGPWGRRKICHRYPEGLPRRELHRLKILAETLGPHAGSGY